MAKNKYAASSADRQKRIDNAIRLSQEAQQRNQVYQQNIASRTGQPVQQGAPDQSVMQRQQAQQYQQAAEQQRMQEDPYGNRAREPEVGRAGGKDPWTEIQSTVSPLTAQSFNQVRPTAQQALLQALQSQLMQRPSFLDQLQESDTYAPYMYDNLLGDPEANIGMGGGYSNSNILGPLAHAFTAQNITPHIPGLLQQLSQYLMGNKGQQQIPNQQQNQMPQQVSMPGVNDAMGRPLTTEQADIIDRNYYAPQVSDNWR